MKLRAAAQMVGVQIRGDLRPQLLGAGLVSVVLTPVIVVGISTLLGDSSRFQLPTSFGVFMITGLVGAFGGLVAMQLSTELGTERFNGTMLRVRVLPNGPLLWAIGKTLSTSVLILAMQVVLVIASLIALDGFTMTPLQALGALGVAVLSVAACAPFGFFAGVLVRGSWSLMAAMGVTGGLFLISGGFFPISILPRWLQLFDVALPFYWSGHLAHALLLDPASGAVEFGGQFQPWIAVGVLLAWTVVGFALVRLVLERSFRRVSLGSLAAIQASMRSQLEV